MSSIQLNNLNYLYKILQVIHIPIIVYETAIFHLIWFIEFRTENKSAAN